MLLDTEGVVWITDFGLAKGDDEGLTQSGDILGTLRYMAPERFRGQSDVRSDIYGLGLTLYELLALRPAFGGTGPDGIGPSGPGEAPGPAWAAVGPRWNRPVRSEWATPSSPPIPRVPRSPDRSTSWPLGSRRERSRSFRSSRITESTLWPWMYCIA